MNMPKGTPVTLFERKQIESYLRMKKQKTWIARKLGRDYSVIKREIKRNGSVHLPYIAVKAEAIVERRKRNTHKRKLEKWQNEHLKKFVEKELILGHSPEQIAGRLKTAPPKNLDSCLDTSISYESIYAYIYSGEGRMEGWYKYL